MAGLSAPVTARTCQAAPADRDGSPSCSTPTSPGSSATAPGRTARTGWPRRSCTAICRCSTWPTASPPAAAAICSLSRSPRSSPRCSPIRAPRRSSSAISPNGPKSAWEARRKHPLALWWHGEFARLRAIWDRFDHNAHRDPGTALRSGRCRARDLGRNARLSPPRPHLEAHPPRPAHRQGAASRALRRRSARLLDARVRLSPRRTLAAPRDRRVRGGAAGQRAVPRRAGDALDRRRRSSAAAWRSGLSLRRQHAPRRDRRALRSAPAPVLDPAERRGRLPARLAHRRPGLVAAGRLPGRRRLSSTSTSGNGPRACGSGG